ncbi:MAG: FtsX-like permease family protein, partial [Thermoanaerobaculia bacterium]
MRSLRALVVPLLVRPARRDRLRFFLTLCGVAVGVATFTAIRLANGSVLSSFSETIDFVAGRASLTILANGPGIPEETLDRLAWLRSRGATLAPALLETAATGAIDGEVVEVLGIDPMSDASVRTYDFAPTAPEARLSLSPLLGIFEPGTVLVTESFARAHALSAGSFLTLVAGASEHRLRVAAVLKPQGAARAAAGSIVFADLATVQSVFGRTGRLDRIDITFPDDVGTEEKIAIEEEIRSSLPAGVTVGPPERRGETVDRMVRAFRINLDALGLVALLVGVFFVYNTLSISVLRRRTEIGTVRALGASARGVFAVFLLEGLTLGVLGSALGLGLGIALAQGALLAVGGTATELYLPSSHPFLHLGAGILLGSFATGVLASVASALAPAWEAARVAPAASMRHGSVEAARRGRTIPLALASAGLAILAVLATRPGPIRGLPLFGFLSVFLIMAAAALATPALLLAAARIADRTALRLFGVEARIARANLTGSLSRTAVAVAALTMGIALMVSVAVMVGSFRTTVILWVDQTLAGDVFITPASGRSSVSFGRMPQEALELIARVPGVVSLDPFLAFSATDEGAPFTVGAGRFAAIAARGNLRLVDGRDSARVAAGALAHGEVFVSEPFAEKFHVTTGSTVRLPTDSGPVALRIAGVYTDYS